MKPIIALVGRPNVGKSTLFNRLTKTRDAIVADFSGLTRDRHYGQAKQGKHEFIVIDTGGFEPENSDKIYKEMAKQTKQAIDEADFIIFLVDIRAGLSADDFEIANYLRCINKPCFLVVNKAEGMKNSPQINEFYELGLGEIKVISAAHGQGVFQLIEEVFENLDFLNIKNKKNIEKIEEEKDKKESKIIKLALAGRPNAGKSTLINTWLGEERLVAFDKPGTTRDAIFIPFEKNGQKFELIDTAGLRRKGKVFEAVEKFSVIKTLRAIDESNIVVLLLDATAGINDQDSHIAGYILESGRSVVIAINKWDILNDYEKTLLKTDIDKKLSFLKFAKLHFISASKNQGLKQVWESILQSYKAGISKISTPKLTRVLLESVKHQTPQKVGNFRAKLKYAHQGGVNPPTIVLHGNSLNLLSPAYKRFLESRFRKAFNLVGTPLKIEVKISDNPYHKK